MTDDPATLLRGLEADVHDPNPRFLDRLHDQLAGELGLAVRRLPVSDAGPRPIPLDARRRRTRWSGRTLLVAAVLAGSAAALGIAGMSLLPPPQDDLLAAVRKAGVLRVEVVAASTTTDFSREVAYRIGERIGIPVAIVDSTDPVGPTADEGWDLALPGQTAVVEPTRFARSSPILAWPVYAVSRTAKRLGDLAGKTMCAVPGTAGALWLEHPDQVESLTEVVPPPPGVRPIHAPSADACRQGLAVSWDGLVTSESGPEPLTGMSGLASVDGSGTEPGTWGFRADPVLTSPVTLVARRDGPDPATLLALVNDAIADLHRDGTFTALSRTAFSTDLTDAPDAVNPDGWPTATEPPSDVFLARPSGPPGSPAPTLGGAAGKDHLLLMVVAPSDDRGTWGDFTFWLARNVAQRLAEQGIAVNVRRIMSGVNISRPVITPGRIILQGPDWVDDEPGLLHSDPAYYWPVHVVSSKEPGHDPEIDQLADLAGRTLCAYEGTPGGQWAAGDPAHLAVGPVATVPPGVTVRLLPTGVGCWDGASASSAVVPTQELRSPFVGMWDWTVGGRPAPGGYVADPVFVHPVSFVVADAPGADELVAQIDEALASLRADGTLLKLSRTTLDGRDLVTPPAP